MKKHAALPVLFCIASASALLSGCATIVKGTTQIIPVSSDPTGARVTVDNSPAGTTPTTVTLSRKQNHMVVIEKEGFTPESIAVTKSMGGAVAGNTISVRLSTKADQPAVASAAANKTKEFIDELNKLDALLVDKKISPEEYGKMRASLIAKYQT